jgi:hypothetical protein
MFGNMEPSITPLKKLKSKVNAQIDKADDRKMLLKTSNKQ